MLNIYFKVDNVLIDSNKFYTYLHKNKVEFKECITITFGDVGENHVGMQKLGKLKDNGFGVDELRNFKVLFEEANCVCNLIDLNKRLDENTRINSEPAAVLVIKGLLHNSRMDAGDIFTEMKSFEWDTKAMMYKKVVNKHARYNVCFNNEAQEPDYEKGKGRIIGWDQVPLLSKLKDLLEETLGDHASNLVAEGNRYYDTKNTGIGFHGDFERRIVIALRLGNSMPLHYQWFQNSKPVGTREIIMLDHGDVYIMSAKAVGFDWKSTKKLTLRHAAGCAKYTTIK